MKISNELPLTKIKEISVHTELLKAFCLMLQARNIISSVKNEETGCAIDSVRDDLDFAQDGLNKESGRLSEIIMQIMRERIDDYVYENMNGGQL